MNNNLFQLGLFSISGVFIRFMSSSRTKKEQLNIDPLLREIIVGLLLGDGWLEKQKVNARLRFEQGDVHKEFLFFVYKFLSIFCQSPPLLRERLDKRTGKVHKSWLVSTKSFPALTEIYNVFYDIDKKKTIPTNIKDYIGPATIAMWIMCDGWKANKGVNLATNSFTIEENILLINALNEKFCLDCRLIKDHSYPTIHIPSKSLFSLQELVLPYMHDSLLYKIHLDSR